MVLWQHVVLCKGALLRDWLWVCVVCYVARDWLLLRSVLRCDRLASLLQRNTLRTPTVRRILNNVPLHNTHAATAPC